MYTIYYRNIFTATDGAGAQGGRSGSGVDSGDLIFGGCTLYVAPSIYIYIYRQILNYIHTYLQIDMANQAGKVLQDFFGDIFGFERTFDTVTRTLFCSNCFTSMRLLA